MTTDRPTEARSTPQASSATSGSDVEAVHSDRAVTMVLVILNAAVFLREQMMSPVALAQFHNRYQLSLEGFQKGAWWQLFSYQFLHGGWWHLGFNLLFLHSLGPVFERIFGRSGYLLLFLGSGVSGGLIHLTGVWMSPTLVSHTVEGASAGLCGLLAALSAIYAEVRLPLLLFFIFPMKVKAKWVLGGVALLTVVGTLVPVGRVAHLSHLGGLLGGLVAVNLLSLERLDLLTAAEASHVKGSNCGKESGEGDDA